ncbi:MAG: Hpt domain-containing protein [Bdellovibrionales bacterium]|nr:Hpt domain-containing protein [Bdellovibrionales bacterium]
MKEAEKIDRRNTKAYPIFLEELSSTTNQVIEFQKNLISANKKQLENLKDIMHRIKGSSGFFGYDELSALSGNLERQFSEVNAASDLSEEFRLDLQKFLLLSQKLIIEKKNA